MSAASSEMRTASCNDALVYRYVMGHSLGEFSALCAAGSFDVEQAITLVVGSDGRVFDSSCSLPRSLMCAAGLQQRSRGKAMQECANRLAEADHSSGDDAAWMIAVMVDHRQALEIARATQERTGAVCEVANINSPSQVRTHHCSAPVDHRDRTPFPMCFTCHSRFSVEIDGRSKKCRPLPAR